MSRLNASNFWKFPDDYFWNCCKLLGESHVKLFASEIDGKITNYCMHIYMYDKVYYHFSCDTALGKELGINAAPLILFDSIIWAKTNGFKWFHMGGGSSLVADSLFKFKLSFGGQAMGSLWYQSVIDEPVYQSLCIGMAFPDASAVKYFPAYRYQCDSKDVS